VPDGAGVFVVIKGVGEIVGVGVTVVAPVGEANAVGVMISPAV
jgi:hypothetical protein